MSFLAAVMLVALGWWIVKLYAKADRSESRKLSNKLSAYALLAFAMLLAIRGHFEYAIPAALAAMGMLGYQQLFARYGLRGKHPPRGGASSTTRDGNVRMTRDEALRVLGLKDAATAEDVKAAHRRLQKDFHPDKGGSDYLASKINEAKDILLG
jgi:hypothetical protein